jgi:hypothetical protein
LFKFIPKGEDSCSYSDALDGQGSILPFSIALTPILTVSVVRVPGYRSTGPGSIPGATIFSEKYWVWNGVHSAL